MGTGFIFQETEEDTIVGNSQRIYEYDPIQDEWLAMELMGVRGRRRAVGMAIDGNGYIMTGITSSFFSRGLYRFNRTGGELGSWFESFNFDGGRRYAAVGFVIGNKGYLGGGSVTDECGNVLPSFKDLWMYEPANDSWIQKSDIGGYFIQGSATFVLGNKAYLWGGNFVSDGPSINNDFWIYTPDKEVFEM